MEHCLCSMWPRLPGQNSVHQKNPHGTYACWRCYAQLYGAADVSRWVSCTTELKPHRCRPILHVQCITLTRSCPDSRAATWISCHLSWWLRDAACLPGLSVSAALHLSSMLAIPALLSKRAGSEQWHSTADAAALHWHIHLHATTGMCCCGHQLKHNCC